MKRKYVKVIAAVIGMAIMNGHPLTLNAKSKKNRTALRRASPSTDMERPHRFP